MTVVQGIFVGRSSSIRSSIVSTLFKVLLVLEEVMKDLAVEECTARHHPFIYLSFSSFFFNLNLLLLLIF